MGVVIGVDIGGTFTDCVAISGDGHVRHAKVPSTHSTSPVEGVLAGLRQLAASSGVGLEALMAQTSRFSHGTTIGTNLLVERKGAQVGLIATRGHRDALTMMRGRGRTAGLPRELVSNFRDTDKPAALVPRALTIEVTERVTKEGDILVALDEGGTLASVRSLLEQDVDAISVALMWGFRNPAHEERVRQLVREVDPAMYVSVSSEVSPRQGEYERTVATVVNSYVGPASARYLEDLEAALRGLGMGPKPFIMQSNGGVQTVDVARRLPVQTIGSGPAGGLAGTLAIARRSGHEHVIATDMGGTSFEVGLIIGGRPVLTSEQVIDQYTFRVSQLDVRSIACGGGSIARLDEHSGGLVVGPESAGADPGPACYGRGTAATVTDADVVLGIIDSDGFLGGDMRLDAEASRRVVGALADRVGLTLEQAAAGILRVNSHSAATLIRQRTLEQGLDPRDFVVYAFGGAGPVHAFTFARELGVREVLVPLGNGASTFSAYGIAVSDVMQIFERECSITAPLHPRELAAVASALEADAVAQMVAAGFDAADVRLERTGLARYSEQYMHELPLALPDDLDAPGVGDQLVAEFRAEYARLYGEAALAVFHGIEVFAVRITARVPMTDVSCATNDEPEAGEAVSRRPVYWPSEQAWIDTAIHTCVPRVGHAVAGPAIIQLAHTSITVPPGDSVTSDAQGNAILTLGSV